MNLSSHTVEDLNYEISFCRDLIVHLKAHRADLINAQQEGRYHIVAGCSEGLEWTESHLMHEECELHQYLCELQLRTTDSLSYMSDEELGSYS